VRRPRVRAAAAAALGASLLLGAVDPAAGAARCLVEAVATFRQARDAGFRFETVRSDATRCEISESTIVVAAPQQNDVTCLFSVLGGRGLVAPWAIKSFTMSSSEGTKVEIFRVQQGWVFRIRAPHGQTSRVSIKGIILVGGDCTKAMDAFD
jgi:hypothetical protein